jgi:hypothetical protein
MVEGSPSPLPPPPAYSRLLSPAKDGIPYMSPIFTAANRFPD